jgi:hypothetical protein
MYQETPEYLYQLLIEIILIVWYQFKELLLKQTTIGADQHIDKLAKKYLNIDRYPSHSYSITQVICKLNQKECTFYHQDTSSL